MPDSDVSAILRYLIFTGERPIYIASTGGADAAMNIGAEFEELEPGPPLVLLPADAPPRESIESRMLVFFD